MSLHTDPAADPERRRRRKLWLPYPVSHPENMPDNPAAPPAVDAWQESEHKRDQGGKFSSTGGGGGAKPKQKQAAAEKPKQAPAKPSKAQHFSKDSEVPKGLNGKAFNSYKPPEDWTKAGGHNHDIDEPPFELPRGKEGSAGLLIREHDGRVWVVKPTNSFGGYKYTFPKGHIDAGEDPQTAAMREAWEESGIKARITGFAGDRLGDTTLTRFYHAVREAGTPADHGWESEGVSLVPPEELNNFLNRGRDKKLASTLKPTIGKPLDISQMQRVGQQLGSNPGGKFEDEDGNRYYVKFSKSPDHAKNELLAAALYDATGAPVLKYHPTADGKGIATQWLDPDKKEGGGFAMNESQRREAQKNFATHAWLANWDALGTSRDHKTGKPIGDNQDMINGKPTTVDTGGSLLYRAQGGPKGDAFGDKVTEWDSLRDEKNAPIPASFFGDMTKAQLKASAARVTRVSDEQIKRLVEKHGPGDAEAKTALAERLIKRRDDIAQRVAKETANDRRIVLDSVLPHSYPVRVRYMPDKAAVAFRIPRFPKAAAHDRRPSAMAFDRAIDNLLFPALVRSRDRIALDFVSARSISKDGHLHVHDNIISRAQVSPYYGEEIPSSEELGLDPKRKYWLLRAPDELEKSLPTWNGLPILADHKPISAEAHDHELVVGSTGSNARFQAPFLRNDLNFWPKEAIDAINNGSRRALSCGYHYVPVMHPGVFEGKKYDGIMTQIHGQHVAMVEEGRVGPMAIVADAMPPGLRGLR